MRPIFVACMLAASASILPVAPATSAPPNVSSHPAAFFETLLPGRVWVYDAAENARGRGFVQGWYLGRDGRIYLCTTTGQKNWAGDAPGPIYEQKLQSYKIVARAHARFGSRRGSAPPRRAPFSVFYAPTTGRFHMEGFWRKKKKLLAPWVGWIQDSWPRVLADACPGLALPEHLAINEKQTSTSIEKLKAQDPDAPIRNFPGSELRVPGAVGQAITGGKPTLTREELAAFMRANHGKILLNYRGKRRVLVVRDDKEEIWKLDAAGRVTNVGHFSPSPDGSTIGIAWERGKSPKWRYTTGFALPYAPTGERFGAFELGDWLIGQASVTLPFFGHRAGFRFSADGKVEATKKDGSVVSGSWRWSRGNLEIRFAEIRDIATYEWRALAKEVGWSPTASAAAR